MSSLSLCLSHTHTLSDALSFSLSHTLSLGALAKGVLLGGVKEKEARRLSSLSLSFSHTHTHTHSLEHSHSLRL